MDADHAQLPRLGDVLGKYRILRMLGQGGMGAVFEAVHARLGQPVAIKVLLPRFLDKPEVLGRFEREARAASQIRGPNVARVIDVDVADSGAPYLVMEYLEGHDVAHELSLRKTLPIDEAVDVVLQACAGMAGAHALGIIHRDLKPSNLFLCEEGSARVVKVLDFGISKITNETDSAVTATEMTIGTPLYMSPEQIRSAKHVDARADVWALGVILYELLAGRPPFTGGSTAVAAAIVADDVPPLRTFRAEVPEPLERAVLRALEKRVDARWPDVGTFATALLPFASAALRARGLTDSGQFTRITLGDVQRIEVDAQPTFPAAAHATTEMAPAARDKEAVTAVPVTAGAPIETRRSKRLVLLAVPIAASVALGAYVMLAPRGAPDAPHAPANASAPVVELAAPPVAPSAAPTVPSSAQTAASAAHPPAVDPPKTAWVAHPKPAASAQPKSSAPPKPSAAKTATPTTPTAAPAATENPIKL